MTAALPFVDHTCDAYARDPHGYLAAARELSPVVTTPDGFGVVSHAACTRVLLDPAFRPGVFEMVRRAAGERAAAPGGRTLLGSEGVDHQELRRLLLPWFTPRRIEETRARTAAVVDGFFTELGDDGDVEVMASLANPLPPAVFCWMVGCDVEAGPELARWSRIALQAFSGDPAVMDDVVAAIGWLRTFADGLIEEKRAVPGEDVTSALVAALDAGSLARRDVRALLTELLSASVDNTTNSIGVAVWLLARHPEAWDAVAAGEVAVERAVEECARFEPVVRHTTVVADHDTEVEGVAIDGGSLVTVYVVAAHRDPVAYADADRFDVFRDPGPPQLEFGIGRHFCLGAALARMEIQEVVRAVTARWAPPVLRDGVRNQLATAGEFAALPLAFRRRGD